MGLLDKDAKERPLHSGQVVDVKDQDGNSLGRMRVSRGNYIVLPRRTVRRDMILAVAGVGGLILGVLYILFGGKVLRTATLVLLSYATGLSLQKKKSSFWFTLFSLAVILLILREIIGFQPVFPPPLWG